MKHQSGRGRIHRAAAARATLVSMVTVGATPTGSSALTIGGATTTLVISGPPDRGGIAEFGQQVLVLSNGNFVVTDPGYDTPTQLDVGAAFLYDGLTNQVISTLTGSNANDHVGRALTEVGTSDFVVQSMYWNNGHGAATWIDASRLVDTRANGQTFDGLHQGSGAIAAGSTTAIQIANRARVTTDASAVIVNVTVTNTQAAGYLTVYPCGATRPNTSNMNFGRGVTSANLVVSNIGADGTMCIYSAASTDLVVDLAAFFGADSTYAAITPARLLDTRAGFVTVDGQDQGAGLRPAGTITEITVAGRAGVPAGAATAGINRTVTGTTSTGFITVMPCGAPVSLTSNLNYVSGDTVADAVVAALDTDGKICLFNSAPVQLIEDVSGYFSI